MEKSNLKVLIFELENLVDKLKTEVYADKDSYLSSPWPRQVIEDDDGYTD